MTTTSRPAAGWGCLGSAIGYSELYGGAGMDYLYAGEFVSELHGGRAPIGARLRAA